jgi:hypothetical protein
VKNTEPAAEICGKHFGMVASQTGGPKKMKITIRALFLSLGTIDRI